MHAPCVTAEVNLARIQANDIVNYDNIDWVGCESTFKPYFDILIPNWNGTAYWEGDFICLPGNIENKKYIFKDPNCHTFKTPNSIEDFIQIIEG